MNGAGASIITNLSIADYDKQRFLDSMGDDTARVFTPQEFDRLYWLRDQIIVMNAVTFVTSALKQSAMRKYQKRIDEAVPMHEDDYGSRLNRKRYPENYGGWIPSER